MRVRHVTVAPMTRAEQVAQHVPGAPGAPDEGGAAVPVATPRPEVAGFEDFYRAHADTVRRALAVTLGDAHVAAEATDEAMTRALARWRSVSAHESPAGWVYRVGLNWAVSRWRRVRREAPLLLSDDAGAAAATTATAVVDPPDPLATAAAVSLRTLPLDQRAVVVCRVLLECSTAETAALLDVPVGTVKSRLARGLAVLRESLSDTEAVPDAGTAAAAPADEAQEAPR